VREPLLAPLASLAAGILLSQIFNVEASVLAWVHLASVLLGVVCLWWRWRIAAVSTCLFTLVLTGALVDAIHRPPPAPLIDAGPQETVLIEGCVVEPPVLFQGRQRFVVELDEKARARVNLYLDEGERPVSLRYGQRVDLEGRIRPPRNYLNPGSFDYATYLERQWIYWSISITSADGVRILPGECGSALPAVVFGMRTALLDHLDGLFANDTEQLAMFRAILFGENTRLERLWQERFRRTGTYHTLVISGLHLTVLAACFLFLLRLLNCGSGWALLLTSLVAWMYAGVTGWNTPVVRAAAGLTLFLAGGYFFRRRRLLNVLAAIAIVFLITDPDQLFDPSFHMSFLAVAAIGAFAVPLIEKTSQPYASAARGIADRDRDLHLEPKTAQFRVELSLVAETLRWLTRIPEKWWLAAMGVALRAFFYFFDLILVSAVIQLALALPMVVYFHRVSASGLMANPVMVLLTVLAVPAGLLAVLTGWQPAAHVAGLLVEASMRLVTVFASLEPGWRIPDPPLWLVALFLLTLTSVGVALRLLRRTRVLAFAAFAGAAAILLWHPFPPEVATGEIELTAIDVGQAESMFVALPDGTLMLVDGGGIPHFGTGPKPRIDIGEDVVSPYLWTRSIKHVDVVVATHGHEDHIGGLPALIENFRPEELWIGVMPGGEPWERLRAAALEHKVRIVKFRQGDRFDFGGAGFSVLSPSADYVPDDVARNDDSLVLRLAYGQHSFLLTGDIEGKIEKWLLKEGLVEHSDVLKVPHHGSRTSTSEALLDAAQPSFAIVSAGFQNTYAFPHPDVLERLERRGVQVLRTDLGGLVTLRSDGRKLEVVERHDGEKWFARRSAFEVGD